MELRTLPMLVNSDLVDEVVELLGAIERNDSGRVQEMIDDELDLNQQIYWRGRYTSPLAHAVIEKSSCLELLLQAGADPNAVVTDGWSPLEIAAHQSREATGPLLQYGADPHLGVELFTKHGAGRITRHNLLLWFLHTVPSRESLEVKGADLLPLYDALMFFESVTAETPVDQGIAGIEKLWASGIRPEQEFQLLGSKASLGGVIGVWLDYYSDEWSPMLAAATAYLLPIAVKNPSQEYPYWSENVKYFPVGMFPRVFVRFIADKRFSKTARSASVSDAQDAKKVYPYLLRGFREALLLPESREEVWLSAEVYRSEGLRFYNKTDEESRMEYGSPYYLTLWDWAVIIFPIAYSMSLVYSTPGGLAFVMRRCDRCVGFERLQALQLWYTGILQDWKGRPLPHPSGWRMMWRLPQEELDGLQVAKDEYIANFKKRGSHE